METVEMREVTYNTLVEYVIARANKEYGSVANFARSGIIEKIAYSSRNGRPLEPAQIMSYLSMPREKGAKKEGAKNFKFLASIFAFWGIKITQQQVVVKRTILRAAL